MRLNEIPQALRKGFANLFGEGQPRGQFFGQSERGNYFGIESLGDGWQRNLSINLSTDRVPAIEGVLHLHGSAGAQLELQVFDTDADGVVTQNVTCPAARLSANANAYETMADLQARAFRQVVEFGHAAVLAVRDERHAVAALHLLDPGTWDVVVDPTTRTPFISVNQNGMLYKPTDATMVVPMRDVFIFKWSARRNNPLLGDSPLKAAAKAAGIHSVLSDSQGAFFQNQRRPSGVLTVDQSLTREQLAQLRGAFDEQAKAWASGGLPILTGGLKFQATTLTSQDAETIATQRLSNEEIARACGVPPSLIGQSDTSSNANSSALIEHWLSVSLGGLINRFERGLDRLFAHDGRTRRIDLNTDALLRLNLQTRAESYSKMIQGGITSPNEVRRREGLSPVVGGDGVWLQRQMTNVDLLAQLNAAELQGKVQPAHVAAAPTKNIAAEVISAFRTARRRAS
jgi:HK97 family phage portal protein